MIPIYSLVRLFVLAGSALVLLACVASKVTLSYWFSSKDINPGHYVPLVVILELISWSCAGRLYVSMNHWQALLLVSAVIALVECGLGFYVHLEFGLVTIPLVALTLAQWYLLRSYEHSSASALPAESLNIRTSHNY